MDFQDLEQLAAELRVEIVYTVAQIGGHLSASLGVIELAVALHHVFNTPEDRIIWDVGHQVPQNNMHMCIYIYITKGHCYCQSSVCIYMLLHYASSDIQCCDNTNFCFGNSNCHYRIKWTKWTIDNWNIFVKLMKREINIAGIPAQNSHRKEV